PARLSARRFAYQHASVLTALDQGMSLIAAGMAEVTIKDGSGEARTPAALYQSLFGAPGPLRRHPAHGQAHGRARAARGQPAPVPATGSCPGAVAPRWQSALCGPNESA
ncbi:hypothetical protein, partial [Methylobacterium radiotolerans]|uniref:hypothetical protein n=1 Tax=Methylobacterium radiotolerans TaxID=31998 RepID=UPI0009D085CF